MAKRGTHATERMVFYTRAHDVPASCHICCLMLGYCLMLGSIAVPESVQKEVNPAVWLSEEIVNHPQLKQLAKSMPGILVQDRAPMTVLSYVQAYQTWKKWAILCNVTALPADPGVFALYLVHLIQKGSSVSLLNSAMELAGFIRKADAHSWAVTY